jgi:hypothetical protein
VKLSGGKSIHLTLDVPTAEAMLRSDDIDLVMEAIESARTLASANSTEFLVVLFPTKEEVYLPVLGEPAPRLVAAIRSILEQRGIAHLDLTPVLQAGARQGERVFFEIDGHPNEAGNHAIAAALISRLCAGAAE